MSEDPYFLIRRSNLPEVIQKTTLVTELLTRRRDMSVLEAVRAIGLSRSAYYKYKDTVRPFSEAMSGKIVTIALTLEHKPGVLSTVLNTVAAKHGNILTINQSLPLQGIATVILSVDTHTLDATLDDLLQILREVAGVSQVVMVGQGS
ncbi:ACT domain-containing protein [Ferroacidibacillus organovorans]|uniref:UPF0735 ACT domain-containing protein ATW55_04835 n=1 Tax=Ferroacidibacillus organovorans TaxID=1765683 RepID=A0A101XP07_9BACL|nr:ACT domain-containing protein [Ferroacidibacillus organovorans]KUO94964.1 hypothetical protein ATW55_04835 [Ferroacidibacillus organovorans]